MIKDENASERKKDSPARLQVFFGIIIVIGIVGLFSLPNRERPAVETREVHITELPRVSAPNLGTAYDKNSLAADAEYKGKVYIVVGYIDRFGRDIRGNPYVGLKTSGLSDVVVYFPRSAEDLLAKFDQGDMLGVPGMIAGTTLGNVAVSAIDNDSMVILLEQMLEGRNR